MSDKGEKGEHVRVADTGQVGGEQFETLRRSYSGCCTDWRDSPGEVGPGLLGLDRCRCGQGPAVTCFTRYPASSLYSSLQNKGEG